MKQIDLNNEIVLYQSEDGKTQLMSSWKEKPCG